MTTSIKQGSWGCFATLVAAAMGCSGAPADEGVGETPPGAIPPGDAPSSGEPTDSSSSVPPGDSPPANPPGDAPPGDSPATPPLAQAGFELLISDVPQQSPSAEAATNPAFVEGNRAFALDVYRELDTEPKNFFFSPNSISTALAMAHLGARGQTQQEMSEALHFDVSEEALHAGFNALGRELASRQVEATEAHVGVTLRTNNDIWAHVREELRPLPSYVDALGQHYGAGVKLVDFDQAEQARETINTEVGRQTNDTVRELIPEGIIIPHHTTMVLTNTIYLKAAWASLFEEQMTFESSFTDLAGGQHAVDSMRQVAQFAHATGPGYAAVRVPYVGEELALTLILPDAGAFDDIEEGLTPQFLADVAAQFESKQVYLQVPKLEVRSNFSLKDVLESLGMVTAFDQALGDFGGIGPAQKYIQDVVHEAFVALDESGTEAGAATAVVFGDESAGPEPDVDFVVDRPFILLLEDLPTQSLLFMGRVVQPE